MRAACFKRCAWVRLLLDSRSGLVLPGLFAMEVNSVATCCSAKTRERRQRPHVHVLALVMRKYKEVESQERHKVRWDGRPITTTARLCVGAARSACGRQPTGIGNTFEIGWLLQRTWEAAHSRVDPARHVWLQSQSARFVLQPRLFLIHGRRPRELAA